MNVYNLNTTLLRGRKDRVNWAMIDKNKIFK